MHINGVKILSRSEVMHPSIQVNERSEEEVEILSYIGLFVITNEPFLYGKLTLDLINVKLIRVLQPLSSYIATHIYFIVRPFAQLYVTLIMLIKHI